MDQRTVIKKGDLNGDGEWSKESAYRLPLITCPKCGGLNLGTSKHGVKPNGDVYHSVICGHLTCDFHDYVTLEGWNNGEIDHE